MFRVLCLHNNTNDNHPSACAGGLLVPSPFKAQLKHRSMTVFNNCSASHSGDLELTLECVANWVEDASNRLQQEQTASTNGAEADDVTSWLLIVMGALVFFMQAGFAVSTSQQSVVACPT